MREIDVDGILAEIFDRCKRRGVSVAKLARTARIAQSTIQRWKTGHMTPSTECLNMMIRAVNELTG